MSTKPNFKPLDLSQATDAQLEAFAARKNMPTILRPAVETAASAGPAQVRRVSLNMPDYVLRQLQGRALEGRCTVRHTIMAALRKDGIKIEDADMSEDGRRER